jgi:myosin V
MTSSSLTVWAPDEKVAYVKGQVPKVEWDAVKNAVLHVLLPSGQLKTCARQQTFRANDDPVHSKHLNDLTVLVFLDEANLLAALKRRYVDNAIYTYMANILIAINPYKDLPLYDIKAWKAVKHVKEPHVFDIAQQALTQMNFVDARTLQYQPQSIICCGESGSGKTVSTKQIMRYLCDTGDTSSKVGITQQVLDANPILEAFGNAKTRRNHNSSRFAKFIKMYFSAAETQVQAAFTETYLLERSRLVAPPVGERNFHIFYYLAHRRHVQEKFRYLGAENISASEAVTQFQDVEQRLRHFQFGETDLSQLWNICSGILYLGNIGAAAKTPSHDEFLVPKDNLPALSALAKYWGLKEDVLQRFLERRNLYVRQEVVEMKMSVHEAHINRDSMAKTFYVKLFQWLVTRINQTIGQVSEEQQQSGRWIGILDVFGFESFENNSFEQFCINLANEKLQNFFNNYVLASEQAEYLREGILWQPRSIQDNSDTVSLLEGKPSGILSLVDSVCIMPKGTPEILVQNIFSLHAKHSRLRVVKPKKGAASVQIQFAVQHYAAEVVYDATDFMAKNNDCQNPDLVRLFQTSSLSLIREIFAPSVESGTSNAGARFVSVGRMFQQQLFHLMQTLSTTTPYFVRCINPNPRQIANDFDAKYVQPQIHCGGLVQAVEMLKYGYPFRLSYVYLATPFQSRLHPQHIPYPVTSALYARNICEALLHHLSQNGSEKLHYQLGITKIFFRSGQQHLLDELLNLAKKDLSSALAQVIHKFLKKRRLDRMKRGMQTVLWCQKRCRGMRYRYRWRHTVRLAVVVAKTWFRVLRRIRSRKLTWAPATPEVPAVATVRRGSSSPRMSMPELDEEQHTAEQKQIESALCVATEERKHLQQEAERLRLEQQQLVQQSERAAADREKAFAEQEQEWQSLLKKTQGELQKTHSEWAQKYQEKVETLEEKQAQLSQWQQKYAEQLSLLENKELSLADLAARETTLAQALQQKNQQVDQKCHELQGVLTKQQSLEQLLIDREKAVKEHQRQLEQMHESMHKLQDKTHELQAEKQHLLQEHRVMLEEQKKDWLQTFRKESFDIKHAFESQITTSQEILGQHEKALQNKDKTIEKLKMHIQHLEASMQQELQTFRKTVQETYERRIRHLEKTLRRQQSEIVKLSELIH